MRLIHEGLFTVVMAAAFLCGVDSLSASAEQQLSCRVLDCSRQDRSVPPAQSEAVVALRVTVMFSRGVIDMAANLAESLAVADCGRARIRAIGWAGGAARVVPCVSFVDSTSGGAGEALFATAEYYAALRTKLHLFTEAVMSARRWKNVSVAVGGHSAVDVRLLPAIVFLDADAQVFGGWLDLMLDALFGTADVDTVLSRQQQGIALPPLPVQENLLGTDDRHGHGAYFQRENRKKINSGVMALHASNPHVQRMFRMANASYLAKGYGDQTALQRAIKTLVREPCAASDESCHRLSTGVLDRTRVNAGLIAPQRASVVIHHAHMSGGHKRENLRAVLDSKKALATVGPLHSGALLSQGALLADFAKGEDPRAKSKLCALVAADASRQPALSKAVGLLLGRHAECDTLPAVESEQPMPTVLRSGTAHTSIAIPPSVATARVEPERTSTNPAVDFSTVVAVTVAIFGPLLVVGTRIWRSTRAIRSV